MAVVAVTPIRHGNDDGTVSVFAIGETVDLDEDALRTLVEGGSAVETSKEKKFNSPYYNPTSEQGGGVRDEDTVKRDALIAGLITEGSPAATLPLVTEDGSEPESKVGQTSSNEVPSTSKPGASDAVAASKAKDEGK